MLRTALLLPLLLLLLLVPDPAAAATCRGEVEGKEGTLRYLMVRDAQRVLQAALCDTRFGEVVIPSARGINRGDGTITALRRAGTKVLYVTGYRESSYGRLGIADVRTGRWTRLDDFNERMNLPDREATYLDASGLALWTHGVGNQTLLVAHRGGRAEVVAESRRGAAFYGPIRVTGANVTWDGRTQPLTARLDRFRSCFPAGEWIDFSTRMATDAVWVKFIGGRLYGCMLPGGAARTPLRCAEPIRGARILTGGPTLAAVCGESPATLAVADLTTGATRLDIPLGVSIDESRMTVSPGGAVAWIDRNRTTLRVLLPGAPGPQDVDTAVRVANPRWTADRTLTWARIGRPGGAGVPRTATL